MRRWLKSLREKKGLTQQNVADMLEISKQYYQMIEARERQQNMDIALLTKLSGVFQIPLIELVKLESDASNICPDTVVPQRAEKVNSD